ncbi:hypothetical protein EV424DRAFT_1545803 [Suillus variegatus]|nr:hypothetical protein EV424DRAFT_1545803 [Suillus variegatus]
MTPADAANKALHETLAAVQLLLKCCMMLQQDDPDALKISDEIARHVVSVVLLPTIPYGITIIDINTFGAGQRLKALRRNCYLVLPAVTVMCCRCVRLLKGWGLCDSTRLDVHHRQQSENPKPPAVQQDDALPPVPSSSDPRSQKSVPKRNRLMSGDEDNVQTRPAFVTQIIRSSKVAPSLLIIEEHAAPAHSNCSEGADDRGFWDVENRPVEWGWDSAIAMAVEKCDKCNKLDVACLVLLDKKITCAINSVGVRERMQAKAKAKAAEDSSNPVRCSKSCVPKSRVVNKTPVNTRFHKMWIQPASSSSQIQHNIVEQGETAPDDQVVSVDVTPARTEVEPMPMISLSVPMELEAARAVDPAAPEPTTRDILQSIQDLGRQLDLFATNERVDELDARLGSVEDIFGRRLNALE